MRLGHMQPSHSSPNACPTHDTSASPPAVPPFISLSTQCDLLYRVGNEPHRYAFISEQSIYTHAAEQLRFSIPSPLYCRTSHMPLPGTRQPSSTTTDVEDEQSKPARVCVTNLSPLLFPSIRWFERAREEELEREQSRPAPSTPTSASLTGSAMNAGLSMTSSPPAPQPSKHLLPSGTGLATCTFYGDYSVRPPLKASTPVAKADTGGAGGLGGSVAVNSTAPPRAAPTPLPSPLLISSPVRVFPSPVVVRAVAQMVLTMQASKQSSAAQFSLVQYRGIPLPAWTYAAKLDPSLSLKATALASRELMIFSVLPQVVAERLHVSAASSSPQGAPSSTGSAAVFYAMTPNPEAPSSSASCLCAGTSATAERKRQRAALPPEDVAVPSAAVGESQIVPGAVYCTRLSGTSSAALCIPLTYSAVTPGTFVRFHHPANGEEETQAAAKSRSAADTTLYSDEAEWLTHGVLRRLYTLPAAPSTASPATAKNEGGAGPASTVPASSTSAPNEVTFLKTNAFLFLSFLVHRTWCQHIHETIAAMLSAWWEAQRSGSAPAQDASFIGVHVTCLPNLIEVRRSPQHEWQSKLTYRLSRPRCATEHNSTVRTSAANGAVKTSAGPRSSAGAWQLTVKVTSRNAELQWYRCGHLVAPSEHAVPSNGCAGKPTSAVECSGTLDDLTRQLL